MEEDILGGLTQGNELQLNIMHATYLVMQCCSESSAADVAKRLFLALHSKYFSEKTPVITCMHLMNLVQISRWCIYFFLVAG